MAGLHEAEGTRIFQLSPVSKIHANNLKFETFSCGLPNYFLYPLTQKKSPLPRGDQFC